ncbi:hypothetical protein BCR37DRAFT_407662 [Protomyces lactucae-debilis]|uniref:Uncharacterized protein n=1 Tax=Protomyces lactucae-debilis TaxID=2754530 RepID=A0A1Y2EMZ2_PROLT|nr:uncharacterized protein BCR37DRAFT_407662 [Protomyces lactucae-debilis]ORY72940.1 hypothetical protein BCR37DRAFT_407662 [Protomyces lactucae-debilis]
MDRILDATGPQQSYSHARAPDSNDIARYYHRKEHFQGICLIAKRLNQTRLLALPLGRCRPNLFSRLSQAFAPAISIARMHYRNSSSLMTFTFTLVSLLLLVIHLELQHAAAEAGRSDGQNSNHGLKKGVDSQSKKRGRGKKQLANLEAAPQRPLQRVFHLQLKALTFFPHDAGNATRKCYNATFLIEYIGPLATDEAVCATEKPSKIKAFQDSMQRTQHEAYEAKQVRSFSRDVSQKTCIQSPRLDIKYFSKTSVISGSCAINCHCTILNYFERIKMPKLRYKGGHFRAVAFQTKVLLESSSSVIRRPSGTDWQTSPRLSLRGSVRKSRSSGRSDVMLSGVIFASVSEGYNQRNITLFLDYVEKVRNHPKNSRDPKKAAQERSWILRGQPALTSRQSIASRLLPRGVTPADNPAHADASSSGQAALAGNSAEPATADLRLDPNDWEEWIATMSNVEQNPTTGLPVDRNVLTMQSCINHGLFNHPGFEQPHADICVAPSHDVQRQGVWSKELMEIKMMISPATLITFSAEPPAFI